MDGIKGLGSSPAIEAPNTIDSQLANVTQTKDSRDIAKAKEAAKQFEALGIRVVIFRIGLILAKDGGALPIIAFPVKIFVGSPLGNGKQYISWIHVDDLCRMFSFAIENKSVHGTFNAVAPAPVTNYEFMNLVGKSINRFIWPLKVPSFIIKIILGEKASLLLDSHRVSSEKIRMTGFNFKHIDLQKNLLELLKK